MNNISILILFNIIIIFLSYKYINKIFLIYSFICILLITLYLQLIYKKNTDIIEGNVFYEEDKEIYTFWDRLNDDPYDDEEEKDKYPILYKINKLMKLLLEIEEKGLEYDKDNECEGEFVINKNELRCGIDVYDTETYKITKSGVNCKHKPGYKRRNYLPLCELDDKCIENRDCKKGKCYRGKCKANFKCNWDKLENCDEKQCDKLNKDVGYNKNTYIDGTCKHNKCNDEQNYNCDKKECKKLGYKYIWDKNKEYCDKNTLDNVHYKNQELLNRKL